jgi:integrase
VISDKQIQKALREVADSERKEVEMKDPGRRGVGRLVLVIRPAASGKPSASWYVVHIRAGRRSKIKVGNYPDMSIPQARKAFQRGHQPAIQPDLTAERRVKRTAGTVLDLFQAYINALRASGKASWRDIRFTLLGSSIEGEPIGGLAEALGATRRAADITTRDIIPCLAAIHRRGSIVHADKARLLLAAAFNWAIRSENSYMEVAPVSHWQIKVNPAAAIPSNPAARRVGNRFLTPVEFRTFWDWCMSQREAAVISYALLLRMATGQRSSEVLRITAESYDKAAGTLFWPTTKNRLPHLIPLPRQAIELLDEMKPTGGWYFPHRRNPTEHATEAALAQAVYRFLKERADFATFAPRDLRRTWKTMAGDAGISKDMRDRLQNHVDGSVAAKHYDRYDGLREKREAMAVWSDYLQGVVDGRITDIGQRNVVSLRAAS